MNEEGRLTRESLDRRIFTRESVCSYDLMNTPSSQKEGLALGIGQICRSSDR